MLKYFLLSIISIGIIGTVSSCGGNDSGVIEEPPIGEDKQTTDQVDLLSTIQQGGEFLIGTEGTYPPFTFHDESGELTGFDVDIARAVAEKLAVEPIFLETQWDAIFAGLDAKRFDMIANQVGIKPDRQEKYDFSNPYISSSAVLVGHKENNEIKGFEDINGLKAAQSLTSNYADIAREHEAEIVGVDGFTQAIELIHTKRVDVTINDKLSVLDYLKQKPDANIKIIATAEDVAQSGLMFRKGNESLVEAVNKALEEIRNDGTYLEISEKWFGEDVS